MSGTTVVPNIPKVQSVVVIPTEFAPFEVAKNIKVAKPGLGELLVKIHAVGLNPVDWKIRKYNYFPELTSPYPLILGTDGAGEVVAIGEGVTNFVIGDRVLFQGFLSNELGMFKQYATAVAKTTAKIPANISYDEAASVPLCFTTASLAFYPPKPIGWGLTPAWEAEGKGKYANQPIFIYGGSGSVGQYAIQLAKISGFSPIITTASLSHIDYLKSLGATHIIDRHEPFDQLSSSIKAITSLPIEHAFDAISEPETQQMVYNVIANNGRMIIILSHSIEKEDSNSGKSVHHVIGNVHILDLHKDKQHSFDMYANLGRLLETGEIKPNRVRVIPGGLAGIITGLKELEKGVSGVKLVANPNA